MTVGWDVVATVTVAQGTLSIKYGHGWEEHLQQDDAWTENLSVQESKLDKWAGKGCEKRKGKYYAKGDPLSHEDPWARAGKGPSGK